MKISKADLKYLTSKSYRCIHCGHFGPVWDEVDDDLFACEKCGDHMTEAELYAPPTYLRQKPEPKQPNIMSGTSQEAADEELGEQFVNNLNLRNSSINRSVGRRLSSLNRQVNFLGLIKNADVIKNQRGDYEQVPTGHAATWGPVRPPQKAQTCEEYFNGWDPSDLFSEMYWTKSFDSEKAFEAMKADAEAEGIILTDADTWDYDGPMYEAYKSDPDKGLS